MTNVYPALRYRDAAGALDWLERVFGARPIDVHQEDGRVVHAEVDFGPGIVMLGSERPGDAERYGAGAGRGWIYVAVADPEAHFARSREAGAEIVDALSDKGYGRDYTARDPEGHMWSFGDYVPRTHARRSVD